jgi:Large ribosomal RNA subunit accumulation protein YceD
MTSKRRMQAVSAVANSNFQTPPAFSWALTKGATVMSKNEPAWSVPVAVQDIAETGLHIEIEAPADTRAGIAKVAALRDLPRLAAAFDLTKQGAEVHLTGQVNATVGQTCVVTLEPIENEIEEAINLTFALPGAGAPAKPNDEPPEPLVGGAIDLGALATEFLILGIDPYPRKTGAKFVPPPGTDIGSHSFAALEVLKKRPGSKQT